MAVCCAHNNNNNNNNSKTKQKVYIYIYIVIVEINREVLSIPTKGPQSLVRKENGTKTINNSMLYCPMYK